MLRGRINNGGYPWPCGLYFGGGQYANVMMAADTKFTPDGLKGGIPQGDAEDMAALQKSYEHVAKLRDEVIAAGIIPPVAEWKSLNPNL
jgi:malate dehydrogenase